MTKLASTEPAIEPATDYPLRFGARFWPLFAFGLIGIASLPLSIIPLLRAGVLAGSLPDLQLPALLALMLINPILLLAAATALGAALAPRSGLRSLLSQRLGMSALLAELRRAAPSAFAIGLGLAAVTAMLDRALQPFLSAEWRAATGADAGEIWSALLMGVLYGGITEEILLRWGLMTLFAWALGWLGERTGMRSKPALMWTAIGFSALVFGVGHLPAAAAIAPLDAALILRTVMLNALAGLAFGWLFWRRHLEAAMLAHASTHVGFALLRAAGLI